MLCHVHAVLDINKRFAIALYEVGSLLVLYLHSRVKVGVVGGVEGVVVAGVAGVAGVGPPVQAGVDREVVVVGVVGACSSHHHHQQYQENGGDTRHADYEG